MTQQPETNHPSPETNQPPPEINTPPSENEPLGEPPSNPEPLWALQGVGVLQEEIKRQKKTRKENKATDFEKEKNHKKKEGLNVLFV